MPTGNKQNKRIDKLADVVLNHHLPFFRFFSTPDRPRREDITALHNEANRLWEKNMVQAIPDVPDNFTVNRFVDKHAVMHSVVLSPLGCTCKDYGQTGKDCVDILAARLLRSNGPISNWEESPFSFDLAIFPGFKWTTVPAHEGLINHLSSNILATIRSLRYPHSFSQLEAPAQQDLLDVADNVGPVSLWVAYIARSLELDPLAVYQTMKDGQIDWTQTEAEELWAQYLEVLDDSPRDDLFDNLQIVVPDIMGPHPALR
ncbi:hypothetical protein FB451DRAFT_1402372 [Mycena latifolia]|nr:hypothetical protein FB451DRAFT_1402372 [Mycena latifolia]